MLPLGVGCPPPARRPRHRSGPVPRGARDWSLRTGSGPAIGGYPVAVPSIALPRPLPRPRSRRVSGSPDDMLPADVAAPEIIEAAGMRWIHIPKPRQATQEWLEERFEFHPLDYEDVYSRNQRPKVDRYDDYIFVVLQFPRFDRDRERLTVVELDLFVGPDYLITMPNARARADRLALRALPGERGGARRLLREGRRVPALQDHRPLRRRVLPDAPQDGPEAGAHRGRHLRGPLARVVRDISNAKQEIINFRRIVRPQRVAFRDLERAMDVTTPEELDVYFDDVIDASERIWDTLENYKEVVEGLESTNESVLSHNVSTTPAGPHRRQRHLPAADAHRQHLRDERATSPARGGRRPSS